MQYLSTKRQTKFITIVMPPMQNLESKHDQKSSIQLHVLNQECVLLENLEQK
ncbi:MAG: hypothetical protein LBE12_10555 [Planctomycetaceae bacterium]|jgi:hypothetical protein|nr:hypothetical protein [Planctomycetaceae bacterium]